MSIVIIEITRKIKREEILRIKTGVAISPNLQHFFLPSIPWTTLSLSRFLSVLKLKTKSTLKNP